MGDDPNVEFLRDLYADWARGAFRRTDVFDPEIEFVTDYPDRATYHGLEGVGQGWRGWLAAWNDFRTVAEKFIPTGDETYVVFVHLSGRGKESGVPIESDAANLVRIAGGKIVHFALFSSRQDALEAAGLVE